MKETKNVTKNVRNILYQFILTVVNNFLSLLFIIEKESRNCFIVIDTTIVKLDAIEFKINAFKIVVL
jgi:hypothetical protein